MGILISSWPFGTYDHRLQNFTICIQIILEIPNLIIRNNLFQLVHFCNFADNILREPKI